MAPLHVHRAQLTELALIRTSLPRVPPLGAAGATLRRLVLVENALTSCGLPPLPSLLEADLSFNAIT